MSLLGSAARWIVIKVDILERRSMHITGQLYNVSNATFLPFRRSVRNQLHRKAANSTNYGTLYALDKAIISSNMTPVRSCLDFPLTISVEPRRTVIKSKPVDSSKTYLTPDYFCALSHCSCQRGTGQYKAASSPYNKAKRNRLSCHTQYELLLGLGLVRQAQRGSTEFPVQVLHTGSISLRRLGTPGPFSVALELGLYWGFRQRTTMPWRVFAR